MPKCRENWRRKRRRAARNAQRCDGFMDREIRRLTLLAHLQALNQWDLQILYGDGSGQPIKDVIGYRSLSTNNS